MSSRSSGESKWKFQGIPFRCRSQDSLNLASLSTSIAKFAWRSSELIILANLNNYLLVLEMIEKARSKSKSKATSQRLQNNR